MMTFSEWMTIRESQSKDPKAKSTAKPKQKQTTTPAPGSRQGWLNNLYAKFRKMKEWSGSVEVPTGNAKDIQPGHPNSASDPEPNPKKHRGKIIHHKGGHENAPGHPRAAVDPR